MVFSASHLEEVSKNFCGKYQKLNYEIVTISAESIPLDFTPARRNARRSTQFRIKGSFSSNESMISEKGLRSFVAPKAP
jgi:uncharacterized membrane-anchored protein